MVEVSPFGHLADCGKFWNVQSPSIWIEDGRVKRFKLLPSITPPKSATQDMVPACAGATDPSDRVKRISKGKQRVKPRAVRIKGKLPRIQGFRFDQLPRSLTNNDLTW